MKKNGLLLALVAGSAASLASAQVETPVLTETRQIRPVGVTLNGVPTQQDSFGERALVTVYDQSGVQTALAPSYDLIEDVSFASSPFNALTGRSVSGIDTWFQITGAAPVALFIAYRFWDEDDVNKLGFTGTGTNMINPAATPLGTVIVNFGTVANGYAYNSSVNFGGPVAIPDDDNGVYVESFFATDAAGTRYTEFTNGLSFHVGFINPNVDPGNPAIVGGTDRSMGRDRSGDGICAGGPVAGAPAEHFAFVSAGNSTGVRMRLIGDVPIATPPCTALGAIADGNTPANSTLAAGEVKWYCFDMNGEATDVAKTYLDMTSNGSSADVAFAIYNADGSVFASDDNDGAGTNANISAGIGIRASEGGDGLQFDGRDGELVSGSYLIAVATAPATFSSGFNATSTGPGGSANVTISTNAQLQAPYTEVAPAIAAGNDLGILVGPTAGQPFDPDVDNNVTVGWYKFQICDPAESAGAYLDLDGSSSDPIGDTEFFLFDAAGNLIATNDDADADGVAPFYLRSHLSFGNAGPRPTYGTDPLEALFTGENGNLPAGTYYLGVGHFNVVEVADAATDGRWHLRGLGGDGIDVAVDFYTDITNGVCGGGTGCAWEVPGGCASDQDADGDVDSDDINLFFAEFENGGSCGDHDGDQDTDSDDITLFFAAFENGAC